MNPPRRAMEDGERTLTAIRGVTGKRLKNQSSAAS